MLSPASPDTIHTGTLTVPVDHPAFAGHFPGQPLLPGVSLLAEVLEAALDVPAIAERIGSAPRVGAVKFLAPVRPGARLSITLTVGARGVRFEVTEADRVAASGTLEPGPTSAGGPHA